MDYPQLIGQTFGPGPEIAVDHDRIDAYCRAVEISPGDGVPVLLVVSLLPALGAGIKLPIPDVRSTVNYGLNRIEQLSEVHVGDVLQATFIIKAFEEVGTALQIVRTAEVTANGKLALSAEALTRFFLMSDV